eukprot:Gregarina_sp_Poly_1__11506@NODE_995_length_5435_cov_497_780179_g698_i0_p3_GENE_NODE_995_length_5435_cov_497_780179_g698_i0NODE_995_length_5435_cov_497_780179_g698_i0_p3_ORF_typecomplete_len350_score37_36_NODE_995_length_5435_cov_497_780179_g698_i041425191
MRPKWLFVGMLAECSELFPEIQEQSSDLTLRDFATSFDFFADTKGFTEGDDTKSTTSFKFLEETEDTETTYPLPDPNDVYIKITPNYLHPRDNSTWGAYSYEGKTNFSEVTIRWFTEGSLDMKRIDVNHNDQVYEYTYNLFSYFGPDVTVCVWAFLHMGPYIFYKDLLIDIDMWCWHDKVYCADAGVDERGLYWPTTLIYPRESMSIMYFMTEDDESPCRYVREMNGGYYSLDCRHMGGVPFPVRTNCADYAHLVTPLWFNWTRAWDNFTLLVDDETGLTRDFTELPGWYPAEAELYSLLQKVKTYAKKESRKLDCSTVEAAFKAHSPQDARSREMKRIQKTECPLRDV